MTPQEFEQQVARIVHALSADSETKVAWNERLPDPDNPTQLRQVDISIKRGDELTLVECRHRAAREDVQWIEELYGRKVSLNASSVIAVSSAGFTRGAIAKASRLGVFLRTLNQVADEEVSTWGTRTTVKVTFVQLKSISLAVLISDSLHLPTPLSALRTDTGQAFPLNGMLTQLARRLGESKAPEGFCVFQVHLNRIFLGMTPVREALVSFNWSRLNREVALPALLAYEDVKPNAKSIDAVVEKNYHNETEVTHGKGGIIVTVDLGTLPFEECCILTGALVSFSKPTNLKAVEMIGPTERQELIQYQVSAMTRSDPRYLRLMACTPFDMKPR